jgi:multidrug efflux system membrane fusion protein
MMQRRFVGGTRAFAAAAVLATAACGHAPKPQAPPAVVVALPVHANADARNGGTGTVRYPVEVTARYSNAMSFRVPGKLIKRNVRLGDAVKEGQILAQLDPVDAQKQFASAKATLDAAEHRLLYARQQLDRDKAQSDANLIAANQLEQTQDSYIAALAGRDQASAQLVVARNNLEYNTLVADHSGLITSENADTGQVVAAGQAVYGLAWNGDTDVILDAAESDLGRIAIGQNAQITFPALPGRQFEARVREIAPAADAQSRTFRVKLQMSGSLDDVRLGMTGDATLLPAAATVAADGANAPGASTNSAPAGSTDARGANTVPANGSHTVPANGSHTAPANGSHTASANGSHTASANGSHTAGSATTPAAVADTVPPHPTFTLPATAIFHQENSPAVWVVTGNDSTLQLRPVKVSSYTDHTSVVTAGLNDGDVVVLAGVHTVYAGQHVKPVRPLFSSEGNIDGPAPATPANASTPPTSSGATAPRTASTPLPSAGAAASRTTSAPQPAAEASTSPAASTHEAPPAATHRPRNQQVAAAQSQAGAQ